MSCWFISLVLFLDLGLVAGGISFVLILLFSCDVWVFMLVFGFGCSVFCWGGLCCLLSFALVVYGLHIVLLCINCVLV